MNILSILITFLVIAIVWTVLKFVFKLTNKIFSCGCAAILLIGLIYFALRFVNSSSF